MSAVTPDDRQGMRLAVQHLAALGHRHIGHLAGPQGVSTGALRAEGFRNAMEEAGLEQAPVVVAAAYSREAGEAAAEELLAQDGLTAIAAANDLLALGAMRAVAARGMRCPEDVSITGHNDMPLVDMVEPPLTTIRISHDLIGREGARLLLERIAQPDVPPAQFVRPPNSFCGHRQRPHADGLPQKLKKGRLQSESNEHEHGNVTTRGRRRTAGAADGAAIAC